ncbi:MAG: adenylate/guanylate cyclase domain-containing protein, partial [Bacteroidota bacterium]
MRCIFTDKNWSGNLANSWIIILLIGLLGLHPSAMAQQTDATQDYPSMEEVHAILQAASAQSRTEDWRQAVRSLDTLLATPGLRLDTPTQLIILDSLVDFCRRQNLNQSIITVRSDVDSIVQSIESSDDPYKFGYWNQRRNRLRAQHGFDLGAAYQDTSAFLEIPYSVLPEYFLVPADDLLVPNADSAFSTRPQWNISRAPKIDSLPRWIAIRLKNSRSASQQFYLQVGSRHEQRGDWERVDLYYRQANGELDHEVSGWSNEVPDKHLKTYGSILPLHLPAGYDDWAFLLIYPSVKGKSGRPALRQIDYPQLQATRQLMNRNGGIFLGILVIQGVYFLLFFISTREKAYLAYVLFLLGLIGFTLAFTLLPDLRPDTSLLQLIISFLSLLSCYAGQLLFSYYFLRTPDQQPLSRKWLRRMLWAMPIAVAIPVLLLAGIGIFAKEQSPLLIVVGITAVVAMLVICLLFIWGLVLSVIMSWRSWRRGYAPARYFIFAQASLLLGVVAPLGLALLSEAFDIFTYLPGTIIVYGLQIGVVFQLSLMALAIGEKRRLLQKDKLASEQALNQELSSLNQAFSRFVPMEFLSAIGRTSVLEVGLGDSVEKEVTVLFSDIRGYTSLSEQMSPNETFEFINQYLGQVAPVVRKHNGFVNQFLGDGIMALFIEAPREALEAGINMQLALAQFNRSRKEPIRMGIGLHSGPLMMGVIGDLDRLDAGVVADAVNTAARVEGLTKHFGASLLVSETIYQTLPESSVWPHRFVGIVQVKGRKAPLRVYDFFIADPPAIRELKDQSLEDFQLGLSLYLNREFERATEAFQRVLEVYPQDRAALRY